MITTLFLMSLAALSQLVLLPTQEAFSSGQIRPIHSVTLSASISHLPSAPSPPDNQAKYRWVPVHLCGNDIVQLGDKPLPVPMHLPSNLKPLGGVGLLMHTKAKGALRFTVYFSGDTQTVMHAWISRFPKDFPIPQTTYNSKTLKMSNYPMQGTWVSVADVNSSLSASFSRMLIFFQYCPHKPSQLDGFNDFTMTLFQAMAAPKSPIRSKYRYISMDVSFFPKTGQK